MDENPYPLRFGLKTLLLTMLTCGIAFGVLSWLPPWPIFTIAMCVPGFWMGLGVAFTASAIPEKGCIGFVRNALVACGLFLTLACVGTVFFVICFVLMAGNPISSLGTLPPRVGRVVRNRETRGQMPHAKQHGRP